MLLSVGCSLPFFHKVFLDHYPANHGIINRGVCMYNRSCSVEDVVFSFVSVPSIVTGVK